MTAPFWIFAARVGLRPWPLAAQYFRHFLHGGGRSIRIDTRELISDDAGVRGHVWENIRTSLSSGVDAGTISIQQPVFTNTQWRLALGSIQLHWSKINQSIILHFEKNYHWTPTTQRISRHIHRAADYAKKRGATEFSMIGQPAEFLISDIHTENTSSKTAPLGNLYL